MHETPGGWMRLLRRPARGAEERDSDALPLSMHIRRREQDPELLRRRTLRRRTLGAALLVVCLAGSLAAVLGEGGYLDSVKLDTEIAGLEAQIAEREAAVERLEVEVRQLETDPTARERLAREQLGLVRPGEIEVLLPRESAREWDVLPPPGDPAAPPP